MLIVPTFLDESRKPRLFVIDTGASANLIDTDAAREATKVHGNQEIVARGVQGRVKDVGLADKVTLTFAGMRQENRDLVAISLRAMSDSTGLQESGLLGMPVLRLLKLTIDYRDGAVKFEKVGR